jgi:hypothetical protein
MAAVTPPRISRDPVQPATSETRQVEQAAAPTAPPSKLVEPVAVTAGDALVLEIREVVHALIIAAELEGSLG